MNSFKMILPVDSILKINKKEIPVTTLILRKKNDIKKFNLLLINHKEKVYEENFSYMDIKLQSFENKVVFNVIEGKKKVRISGRKNLPDELLKNYFEPEIT